MPKKLDVVELFAGVGGFRCGLESASSEFFQTIWSNQWEPSTKKQYAFQCYNSHFKDSINVNKDINESIEEVPKHQLLVGGFPCQDYSVAATGAKGIEGKKGALWWAMYKIMKKWRPDYILLENVDRIVRSPRENKGRDFSIILRSLNDLGYCVEWRIINAADYGCLQKRNRAFIFASRLNTKHSQLIRKHNAIDILSTEGFFQSPFPIKNILVEKMTTLDLSRRNYKDVKILSDNFTGSEANKYYNSGIMINGVVNSYQITPLKSNQAELKSILLNDVPEQYYISNNELHDWEYYKGRKVEPRRAKGGFEYIYREGAISFPDSVEKPARTILTSEGLKNRSTHIILDPTTGLLRRLMPEECELINGFELGWTAGMPERKRLFVMGNSLVVPLITKMGKRIIEIV